MGRIPNHYKRIVKNILTEVGIKEAMFIKHLQNGYLKDLSIKILYQVFIGR